MGLWKYHHDKLLPTFGPDGAFCLLHFWSQRPQRIHEVKEDVCYYNFIQINSTSNFSPKSFKSLATDSRRGIPFFILNSSISLSGSPGINTLCCPSTVLAERNLFIHLSIFLFKIISRPKGVNTHSTKKMADAFSRLFGRHGNICRKRRYPRTIIGAA